MLLSIFTINQSSRVLLQSPTLRVFYLDQTDLLVAEVEGLLAPMPMQLQDGNKVPNGSKDGEAQDRVNMDPWVLPCAIGESLVLQHGYEQRFSFTWTWGLKQNNVTAASVDEHKEILFID